MAEASKLAPEVLDELLKGVKSEQDLNSVFRQLSKQLIERALEAEMTEHLGHDKGGVVINPEANIRNGVGKKTVQGELGEVELDIPRDRQSSFEPQLVKKHQRRLVGLDSRILSLYARGLSTRDIQAELKDIYDVEVSPTLISEVTDAVLEEVRAWQMRPLNTLYPVVYLDCIFAKLRVNGVVRTQAVYVAIALNLSGLKEVLGLWIGREAKEGAKFWLGVLTELQQRGVEDVFIFCVDGLKGFPEAIEQVYPQSQIQLCIVHLIRNSMVFVGVNAKPLPKTSRRFTQPRTSKKPRKRWPNSSRPTRIAIPLLLSYGGGTGSMSSPSSITQPTLEGQSTPPTSSNH